MITFFRRHAATLAVILTVAGFATPAVVSAQDAPKAAAEAPAAAPAAPAATAPAPAPAIRSARVTCANYIEVMQSIVYPREALRENLEGEVVIEFTVSASGQVKDTVIKSSTNRVFNRASMAVVSQLSCQGQGQDVRVQAPISFKLR